MALRVEQFLSPDAKLLPARGVAHGGFSYNLEDNRTSPSGEVLAHNTWLPENILGPLSQSVKANIVKNLSDSSRPIISALHEDSFSRVPLRTQAKLKISRHK